MKFIHYSEFKNTFSVFSRIVVTGPQRSGTKIIANIISIDTGFDLVRHTKMMPFLGGIDRFKESENIVLHSPSYVAFLEDIQDEHTAIVYCLRNLDDIVASERKWGLHEDDRLIRELAFLSWKGYLDDKDIIEINPAKVKNILWEQVLERKLQNSFTVRYEELEGHDLWVSKDERDKFTNVNQVSVNGDIYRINNKNL